MIAQYLVTLGVWSALLTDVLGNWAGQDNYDMTSCFAPVVWGTSLVTFLVAGLTIGRLRS